LDDDFEWDEANIGHIAAHGVSPTEAEDAILDPRRIGGQAHSTATERRRAVIGATADGRILYVVFTVIGDAYRIITAYDANDRQKRRYRRGRK
jgi:uncharacterized protein